MKNIVNFGIVTILLASLGMVVADEPSNTLITGKIYNVDFTQTIVGADVEVVCNNASQNVTSESNGKYTAIYNKEICNAGDSLVIYAEKDGLRGVASGVIHENAILNNWDLGVVNVAIVPEFGFFLGILTLLSAVGIFFIVRK
jgi:hypothetical protein